MYTSQDTILEIQAIVYSTKILSGGETITSIRMQSSAFRHANIEDKLKAKVFVVKFCTVVNQFKRIIERGEAVNHRARYYRSRSNDQLRIFFFGTFNKHTKH
jgi:hypothetical protein